MVGFEITDEDVRTVLDPHGLIIADTAHIKEDEEFNDRVVKEVFERLTPEERSWIGEVEGDLDSMTDQALARLEQVLRRKGVVTNNTDYFAVEDE